MERVIQFSRGNFSIKASPAKDKNGRKGYFIAESDLADAEGKVIVKNGESKPSKKNTVAKKVVPTKKQSSIRPEVEEVLNEMRDYKDGKLTLRSIDDVLRTV